MLRNAMFIKTVIYKRIYTGADTMPNTVLDVVCYQCLWEWLNPFILFCL